MLHQPLCRETERLGELAADQHSLIPGKTDEQVFLKAMSRHLESKHVTKSHHCGFAKAKLCLTNLITFHNEMIISKDKGRTANVIYYRPR